MNSLHSFHPTRDHNNNSPYDRYPATSDDTHQLGEESLPLAPFGNAEHTSEVPAAHTYLLNLFLTNNMDAFLSTPSFAEDIGALPFHMQSLIYEAKEEAVFNGMYPSKRTQALSKLRHMREYMLKQSSGDNDMLLTLIADLMANDDVLAQMLETQG